MIHKTTRYYAGVGSRKTPPDILKIMYRVGKALRQKHYVLHTGGAMGADKAFMEGVGSPTPEGPNVMTVFDPSMTSATVHPEAYEVAEHYHPNWAACNDFAKACHARNVQIVLGVFLRNPVNFVVCWTEDGKEVGGTAQAMRVARDYAIPVFNLANASHVSLVQSQFLVEA